MDYIFFILLVVAWLIGIIFFRTYKIWAFYYLLGTTGLAFILVFVAKDIFHAEIALAESIAVGVHNVGNLLNIPTQIFPRAPGLIFVLVVVQKVGWTALAIGIESSGLLEMSVLGSLVLFYPGWNLAIRISRLMIGLTLTWIANTARMVLIMLMLHFMGKEVLVIAHTFLGKLFFFVFTIVIYWFLITLPSLELIEKNILARRASIKKA